MSKSKYKKGDEVWVKGVYDTGDNGRAWVEIPCVYCIMHSNTDTCSVKVRPAQLKPDVTFKWSPAKAKKKGSKK